MKKKRYALWTTMVIAASLGLSGCQLLTGYQKIDEAHSAKAWAGKIYPVAGEVNIACIGTYHCEIVQIDRTSIIKPDSHEPANPAMLSVMSSQHGDKDKAGLQDNLKMTPLTQKKAIKIVPLSASAFPGLTNYYARVMPAKREVHVNFYPENNMQYIERFAMIHDFTAPGTYQLRAYQKKPVKNSGSLLESASPEPLCIELLQDSSIQRRFCKQLGAEHQGEFVETSLVPLKTPATAKHVKAS